MANPYVDIWMRAGETAARQHQDRLLADIHHAQVEASREGPRSEPRLRSLKALLQEIDGLAAMGVKELEFIDEALPPWPALLQALRRRDLRFTARVRANAWPSDLLDLLHEAGWRAYAEEADLKGGAPAERSVRRPLERPSLNG